MNIAQWNALDDVAKNVALGPLRDTVVRAASRMRLLGVDPDDVLFLVFDAGYAIEHLRIDAPKDADWFICPLDNARKWASEHAARGPVDGDIVFEKARAAMRLDPNMGERAVVVLPDVSDPSVTHAFPLHFVRVVRGGTA